MLIGILSDTHDHIENMRAGLDRLKAAGAQYYIHCGDIGGERAIDLLVGLPAVFVWGNTDWNHAALSRYAKEVGVNCAGKVSRLSFDGKRLIVIHGDDLVLKQDILMRGLCDYLLQGHTHVSEDVRVGTTRIINPGALFRTRQKSVALLDTAGDELRFLPIDAS